MTLIADWIRHLSKRPLPQDPRARRQFLKQAALATAGLALSGPLTRSMAQAPRVRFVAEPFTLGVASGYPTPTGFTLWTRLAPAPLMADGGMAPERVPMVCEVAADEGFRTMARSVSCEAYPEVGHSVRLDIDGLAPGRPWWYRFRAGDALSPVGRTLTLPAPASRLDAYRIAFASCQHYEQGHFSAYRAMREDAPDLVLFLGDYIYESDWGSDRIRRHHGPEPMDLAGYRTRHAQYKLDADLRAAHAEMPFCFAWDDHEVDNDYAADVSENLDPGFLLRRAAAYQAFFEHLPVPRRMYPRGPDMRTHTHFDVGDLLRVYLLDDRQYRTPQPCPRPNRHASQTLVGCAELNDPAQTLLGADQERWFDQACAASRARWNLVGQQTLVAPLDDQPGPDRSVWTDGWDGYPLARKRLLDSLRRVRNPVIAGGDLHASVVAAVPSDPERFDSRPIASEFVATSISADGWPQSRYDEARADNPHVLLSRSDQRGYTLLEFGRDAVEASLRVVDDVRSATPSFSTQARFRVEDGRPGPKPI